jgi:predicted O-methyltransferase YrrM
VADGLRENKLCGKVVTVDLFNEKGMTKRSVQGSEDATRANITEKGLDSYIEVVVGYTAHTADVFKGHKFNFVFIDADHSYKGCMEDFLAWSPLVREGGLIGFHDANRQPVLKVLSELADHGWKMQQWIGTLSIWRRKNV